MNALHERHLSNESNDIRNVLIQLGGGGGGLLSFLFPEHQPTCVWLGTVAPAPLCLGHGSASCPLWNKAYSVFVQWKLTSSYTNYMLIFNQLTECMFISPQIRTRQNWKSTRFIFLYPLLFQFTNQTEMWRIRYFKTPKLTLSGPCGDGGPKPFPDRQTKTQVRRLMLYMYIQS